MKSLHERPARTDCLEVVYLQPNKPMKLAVAFGTRSLSAGR